MSDVASSKPGTSIKGRKLAILAAEFNQPLIEAMIAAAQEEAAASSAEVTTVVRVPGCYEVPLLAARILERAGIDALIVLGYIERGETGHGEVMGHVVHSALTALSLQHTKPVALGIIGPGATPEQAETRKVAYAKAAVKAALASLTAMHTLP